MTARWRDARRPMPWRGLNSVERNPGRPVPGGPLAPRSRAQRRSLLTGSGLESAYLAARVAGANDTEALARARAEVPDWSVLARNLVRIEHPLAARLRPGVRSPADPPIAGRIARRNHDRVRPGRPLRATLAGS